MELISKLLFWVANSLLIPDIIILLCLFVRSLILIGGTYNMYMTKRKNDKALDQLLNLGWKFLLPISLGNLLLTTSFQLSSL